MANQGPKDQNTTTITGSTINAPVTTGAQNTVSMQTGGATPAPAVTPADLEALRAALAALQRQVEAQTTAEQRPIALDHVKELSETLTSPEPDLSTIAHIKKWFAKNAPGLAGAVTGVILHPVVGKVVTAAGDALAAKFKEMING
jgi:hypothetical protein